MGWPGHRLALLIAAGVLAAWLGVMAVSLRAAALPPEASGTMLVVFPPQMQADAAFAALVRAGALPIRKTWLGFVWVASAPEAGRLLTEGAMGTYRDLPVSPEIAGCFAYADAKMQEMFAF